MKKYGIVDNDDTKVRGELYTSMKGTWTGDISTSVEPLQKNIRDMANLTGNAEFIQDMENNAIPAVERYLMFNTRDKYMHPVNNDIPAKAGTPIIENYTKIKGRRYELNNRTLGNTNPIVNELKKDHVKITGQQFKGIQSQHLLAPVGKYGMTTVSKTMDYYDIRGLNKGLMKNLVGRMSVSDPNNLQSNGKYNLRDLIETSKGIGNESFADELTEEFMKRTGDKEYGAYYNFKNRFLNPGQTQEEKINKIYNNNIVSDIMKNKR